MHGDGAHLACASHLRLLTLLAKRLEKMLQANCGTIGRPTFRHNNPLVPPNRNEIPASNVNIRSPAMRRRLRSDLRVLGAFNALGESIWQHYTTLQATTSARRAPTLQRRQATSTPTFPAQRPSLP